MTASVDVKGFSRAHEEIGRQTGELRLAARMMPMLSRADRERVRGDVLRMLREDIEPHTKLDEELLYPAVAERLGDPLVAASMSYDHLAIREWIGDIGDTDIDDIPHLQGLLYGLDALIRVHVWKEDALFLDPLQRPSWPG